MSADPPDPGLLAEQLTMKDFIYMSLAVTIRDGRQFEGRLLCTDQDCNVILEDAYERLPPNVRSRRQLAAYGERRSIGLIVVPGREITSIDAATGELQARARLRAGIV
ncbi:uncharacterized protein V1510DRAFT_419757 [Dipodascopsis tothii]|uniref:uncharacterized protein n=1 Tax=Dipodascopsis tothii TaxID=44089 RepID=UPI0034CD82F7